MCTQLAPAGRSLLLFCAIVVGLFAAATPTASAEDPPLFRELPDVILAPWNSSQLPAGNFQRPSSSAVTGGYGNDAIAYAMLLEASREDNDPYFRSAMAAFAFNARTPPRPQGVFTKMFAAAGFNLATRKFGQRAEFLAIKGAWAQRLRRFRYDDSRLGERYRYNKNLVEALEIFELLETGLKSRHSGAILRNPTVARRRALRAMNVLIPERARAYSQTVGTAEGWPQTVELADLSDPPDNPPAYNALVAGMYARAYATMPTRWRTARMRSTARMLIRGVIARTAPDGDLAFSGRSQEQAWALSLAAYGAWYVARLVDEGERPTMLAFAKRVTDRIQLEHVTTESSVGFALTPAQKCCDRNDHPPGQDNYFEIAGYIGLTAATLGWAIEARPPDWRRRAAPRIPTDLPSRYAFRQGRGRFIQFRGGGIYWLLRMQSDFADARADMAVSVLKSRRTDGSWADVVPPRPYSGGHHRPADPASPCLAYGRDFAKCAYLELHGAYPTVSGWAFDAVWRTPRGTALKRSTASVVPTNRGLRLSWSTEVGEVYKVDHFLPRARCTATGVSGPGIAIGVSGQADCRVIAKDYAGGSRIDLDRIRSVAGSADGQITVEYVAATA